MENSQNPAFDINQLFSILAATVQTSKDIVENNKAMLKLKEENDNLKRNSEGSEQASQLNYLKLIDSNLGDVKTTKKMVEGQEVVVNNGYLGIEASNGDRYYRLILAEAKLQHVLNAEGEVVKKWTIFEDKKRTVLAWNRQQELSNGETIWTADLLWNTAKEFVETGSPVIGFIQEVNVLPYQIGDNDNITRVNVAVLNYQRGTPDAEQNIYQQLYSQKVHDGGFPHVINEESDFAYGYLLFCAKKAGLTITTIKDAEGSERKVAKGSLNTHRGFAVTGADMKGICEHLNKTYKWNVTNAVEASTPSILDEEDDDETTTKKKASKKAPQIEN